MSVTKFLANEFNGEQVIRYFDVAPDKSAIRAAMNFMFRTMKDELSFPSLDLASRSQEIASCTQEAIEYRYALLTEFHENFFSNEAVDLDALGVAVICNEYVIHINEPCQTPDGDIKEQYDGIECDLAERAQIIWEDAGCLLEKSAMPYECSKESLFLAHVIAFETLAKCEADSESDDEYDYTEIRAMIPIVRSFLKKQTDIGQALKGFINSMEKDFPPLLPSPPANETLPSPSVRPFLYIVSTPTNDGFK